MTCIVGLEHEHGVTIGGDSAGVSGYSLTVRSDEKVFANGPFVMGFTSSFRMGQLLRYRLAVPEHPDDMDPMEYLATEFVDAVRACLREGGWLEKSDERESGGSFLVAYRGVLYELNGDFQVGRAAHRIAAVGCGHAVAVGALHALQAATNGDLSPERKIRLALEAAEGWNAGVRGPFTVITQPRDE